MDRPAIANPLTLYLNNKKTRIRIHKMKWKYKLIVQTTSLIHHKMKKTKQKGKNTTH